MFVTAAAIVAAFVILAVVFERPAAVITDATDISKILALMLAAHRVVVDDVGDGGGNTVVAVAAVAAFRAAAAVADIVVAGHVSVFQLGFVNVRGALAFSSVVVCQTCVFEVRD